MFKKALLLLVLSVVGLGYAISAQAENGTSINQGEGVGKKDERPLRERAREWKTERRERVKAELNRIRERFTAAFERSDRLIAKIDERIAMFEEKGLDVTIAKAKIAEAKTLITEAKAMFETLKSKIELAGTQLTGEKVKPLMLIEETRLAIINLVEKIKSAHAKVRETIQALKDARVQTEQN